MSVFLLASLALAAAPAAQAAAASQRLAITGVTVIDPTAASAASARLPDRTVLIAAGRITAVGPSGGVSIPGDYTAIDGRGAFLVPGYWDMHVHFNRDSATAFRVMGPMMIASGVTSVRDMWSDCWEPCAPGRKSLADMRAWQEAIGRGALLAPRFQALSSPIVHGPVSGFGYPAEFPAYWRPGTEAEGRELARDLKARGSDFIKIYESLSLEAYLGLQDEANRLRLPVTGHLPGSVDIENAARAGIRSIEHARMPISACNQKYESLRAMNQRIAVGTDSFDLRIFRPFRQAMVDGFDRELCARIVKTLADNGVYLVPTILTREMDARADEPTYADDPRIRYVPANRLRGWRRDLANTARVHPEIRELYDVVFRDLFAVTHMAHAAGVTILVGTDAFDTMVFPGLSYVDEMAFLGRAGLPPLAILRAATTEAAAFLGKEADYGAVAAGKVADLVLLDADPLLDVHNAARIRAVIFRGHAFDRAALDALLRGVESFVAGGAGSPTGPGR